MTGKRQLDSLDWLREVVAAHYDDLRERERVDAEEIYCPRCSDRRRVKITEMALRGRGHEPELKGFDRLVRSPDVESDRTLKRLKADGMAPALFMFECCQCKAEFSAVVYRGPGGEELAVFPGVAGGLTTMHTPPAVAYYLDQAARAQAASARSAAVAMYRVALEQMLEDKGYTQRMCGPKISALESDLKNGKAAKWAADADPEVMRQLAQLGNGVLHANGGDITLQANATPELLESISLAFEALLDLAYEREVKAAARKAALTAAASKLTK